MKRSTARFVIAFSFLGFLAAALGNLTGTSPTSDEVPHLVAGWSYFKFHDFRVNTEHPPLLKLLAALPLLQMKVWPPTLSANGDAAIAAAAQVWPLTRSTAWAQWLFAHRVIYAVRNDFARRPATEAIPRSAFLNNSRVMFLRARLLLLLVCGLGLAIVIVSWSYELWGVTGAALSALFFCFDPNFIAHASLVTTDVGVSFFMAGAVYFLWRASRHFTPANVGAFASFTALAFVSKYSAVILIPVIAVLLLFVTRDPRRVLLLAASAAAMTVIVIWAAYGFRFDATHGQLPIRSLVGSAEKRDGAGSMVRFANDHRLLPQPYLYGLSRLRADESRETFLRGAKLPNGVRSYFFWTFITKTPLPAIIAIVAAVGLLIWRRDRDLPFMLVPALFYFAVAVAGNLDIGHRHILPIYPFLYVCCGSLPRRFLAVAALSVISCFVVFTPWDLLWGRHLSYFNEFAGGPRHGYEIIIDSNIDWGQDLPRLAQWLSSHQVREPINLVWLGSADPRYYGIRFRNLDGNYWALPEVAASDVTEPGWLAISASAYEGEGASYFSYWRDFIAERKGTFAGSAGYSILIFRLRGISHHDGK